MSNTTQQDAAKRRLKICRTSHRPQNVRKTKTAIRINTINMIIEKQLGGRISTNIRLIFIDHSHNKNTLVQTSIQPEIIFLVAMRAIANNTTKFKTMLVGIHVNFLGDLECLAAMKTVLFVLYINRRCSVWSVLSQNCVADARPT